MRSNIQRLIFGLSVATFAIAAVARGSAAPTRAPVVAPPGIVGTIHGPKGDVMGGVVVSARAAGSMVTTSVYSDDKGIFVFPHMPAGQYDVWAQATGFRTNRTKLALDGARAVTGDLVMTSLDDPRPQLTGYEWFQSLPGKTADQQRLKQILYVGCTGCHSLDVALQNTFDEAGWNIVIKSMENAFYTGHRPGNLTPEQMRWEGQIIRHHRPELARYLAQVRGPDAPALDPKILERPTGDAARAVFTEYDLPVKEKENQAPLYQGHDWMLGPSTGMHGVVGIHDVIVDAQGMAWITQSRTTFETNRSLVKLDPQTGAMDAYRVTAPDGELLFFEQIASPDPKGDIWMHGGDYMVRLSPKTETFTSWPEPKVMKGMLNSTDADSKGRAFANSSFGTVMFDPAELGRKDVMYPGWHKYQQLTPGDGVTYGITADADDNVWWSESYVDKVAMRNMKTGKVVEFDMHDPDYDARKGLATAADLAFYDSVGGGTWGTNSASPLPYMNMPRRLSADKQGDTVWVPTWAQSSLAEINIHSLKVTYHKLPIQVHPYKTTVDRFHNVWTDVALAEGAYRYTPATDSWTLFRLPSHGCGSRHISFDDARNELWVPCDQSNKVVRVQFRTPEQLQAAQVAAGAAK